MKPLLILLGVFVTIIPALFWGVNNGITLTGVLLFGTGVYHQLKGTRS